MNWINAKETLPGNCNEQIVVIQNRATGRIKVSVSHLNPAKTGFYVEYDKEGFNPIEDVTHWMPLPEPPKA